MLTEPFVLRALAAAVMLAILAGSLGCFITWKRMVFLGDSLAHSALLGIVLGVALGANLQLATLIFSVFYALLLVWLERHANLTTDSILGTLAHSGLALGLVILALLERPDINLHGYLFGDILTVNSVDLTWIVLGAILILAGLIKFKQDLILCAIHEDLARSEGVSVNRLNMIFTFMMTIAIAISIQVIGLLLITSLLIIPPATSRLISKNPNQMIVFAIMFGFIAVVSGGMASIFLDLPTGPVMVVAASALFMLIVPFRQI